MKRLLLICGLALAFAAPASAGGGSSITLDQASPHWGDSITFTYTASAGPVYIYVVCGDSLYHGLPSGAVLYGGASYPAALSGTSDPFTLTSGVTVTGYCSASLIQSRNATTQHTLAKTVFTVSP